MHGCRTALEQQFHKLRTFIASSREKALKQTTGSALDLKAVAEEDAARQLRHVFKEGMYIGEVWYLVEMSTIGRELHISAYDAGSERMLDLTAKDEAYQNLLKESAWDYSVIAKRLRHGTMFSAVGEQVRLELAPAEPNTHRMSEKPKNLHRPGIRPGNSVYPAGDGPKPPQIGQLKLASAVLAAKKNDPIGTSIGDAATRPIIRSFLKADVPGRQE